MTEKSLCDKCPLNRICRIRVLSAEIGKPIGDYRSKLKEAVLKCQYYDTHHAVIWERARILSGIESMLERDFKFLDRDAYRSKLREAIYGSY